MTGTERHWTLRSRLRTGLLAAGVALGIMLALAAVALGQVSRYQDEVTAVIFRAVLELQALETQLIDADSAVRGYLLTGEPEMLTPFTELDLDRVDDVRAYLARELPDAVVLDTVLLDLDTAITEWHDGRALPAVEGVQRDGPDPEFRSVVPSVDGSFTAVREASEAAFEQLTAYRDAAADQLRAWRTTLLWLLVAIGVAAVGIGTGLWAYLRRWVTDPLDRLAADSRAVSDGDLDRPVRGSGPQEIVRLAADVELMRRRLVEDLAVVEASRAELAASNRDLEQFAYVASHDLQEPLRKVASFTQLLQRRYGGQLDDRGDQYIEFAVDGARRMQRLIQDLLAFSRLGRGGEEPTRVALAECLADAVANLEEAITESGAKVEVDGELPTVVGHRGALTQLLQNLVGNAVKFRAADRAPRIVVGAHRAGAQWVLRCVDNGIGIEPRHAERVFAIFQRLHAKDAYAGTGIGLAMCQRIVELHGGRIWVEERAEDESPGTTVRWTLPVADDPTVIATLRPVVVHNNATEPTEVEP